MEIRRFGVGHRRPEGPVGTRRVHGQTIHVDERGVVAELALDRNGSIPPHSNPNLTYFLVIEGGGFVRVGDETARVSVGDAVVWPPDVIHAAWTETSPMRAIVVEFAEPADEARLLMPGDPVLVELEGPAETGASGDAGTVSRLDREVPTGPTPTAEDGEPW